MEKKKAVIYCRVSTKEQAEEGNSLKTQEKICTEYCHSHNYEIAQIFIEQGESAKTADRTELKKLLSFCANKKSQINAIVIYKIDRLSRNTDDYSQLRLFLKRYGVEIKSTSEFFEDNPVGRFMENTMANIAQFDNDIRAERCIGGMREAVREGRYVWNAPLGYNNVKVDGKATIAPDQKLFPLLRQVFELLAQSDYSVEQIRQIMQHRGLVNRKGVPLSKSCFYFVINSEIYTGWISKFGERHKGSFEPLISEEVFKKVVYRLKNKALKNNPHTKDNPDFPLRRFVFHPTGQRLTGAWSSGRREKYPYYFFRLPKSIYPKNQLENNFMTFLDTFKLPKIYYSKLSKFVSEELTKDQNATRENRILYTKHIEVLKQKQNTIIQKNLDNIIPDTVLKQQLGLIEKEIATLEGLLEKPLQDEINYSIAFKGIREFVEHPAETWKKACFKKKILLQWFYFPNGIIFDGINCRTHEKCCIFKLKELFDANNSFNVHPSNSISNTTHAPHSPSNKENNQLEYSLYKEEFLKELVSLTKITQESATSEGITSL